MQPCPVQTERKREQERQPTGEIGGQQQKRKSQTYCDRLMEIKELELFMGYLMYYLI